MTADFEFSKSTNGSDVTTVRKGDLAVVWLDGESKEFVALVNEVDNHGVRFTRDGEEEVGDIWVPWRGISSMRLASGDDQSKNLNKAWKRLLAEKRA